MPISTMLKRVSPQVERVGEHADLPDDFARRQVAHQSHRRREAEGAAHRAADLRRDAEGLVAACRGMNTDSMCRPSSSVSRNFWVPSLDDIAAGDRERRDAETPGERLARGRAARSVIAAKSVTPRR